MASRLVNACLFAGAFFLHASALAAETVPEAIMSADAKGLFTSAYSSVSPKKSVSVQEIAGRKALKIDLRYEWKGGSLDWIRFGKPGYAQRSQFYEKEPKRMKPGKDYWYTLSVFIPPEMERVKTYLQLFDLKYAIDANGTVPGMQFILYPKENLTFESSIGSRWICGTYRSAEGGRTPICNRTTSEGQIGTQAELSGRWLEMVAHFRWAKEDGVVNIWFDGKPIYAATGDTLKGAKDVQFKFGPYRIEMKGDPGPVTLYYSHVARAGTCEALAVKGCDSTYATPPAPGLQNVTAVMVTPFNELDQMKVEGRDVRLYGGADYPQTIPADLLVETQQQWDDHPGDAPLVVVGLSSKVHESKDKRTMIPFTFQGTYNKTDKRFVKLELIVGEPVGAFPPAGLPACGASTVFWQDDKQYRLIIPFDQVDGNFVARNADCIFAAIPAKAAAKAALLIDHFSDVAVGLVSNGGDAMLTNDNFRAFMGEVAFGRVKVTR